MKDGLIPSRHYCGSLSEFHDKAMTSTGVGVYCRNGANRSVAYLTGYLMARGGCSVEGAFGHAYQVRHLADLSPSTHYK